MADLRDQIYFTIQDRNYIAVEDGEEVMRPRVFPEDWFFSALCASLGLKVLVTRKVRAGHVGKATWWNTEPWGEWDEDKGDG
jgi:hypothetical protein